ncbi:MAG: YqgE/AlgH family protein [Acidobacteriota bacterium]
MKRQVSIMTIGVLLGALSFALICPSVNGNSIAAEHPFLLRGMTEHILSGDPSSDERPSKGKFLVATSRINDPRFREAVILLINYDSNGTLGLIINRPTEVKISTLFPGVRELQKRLDTAFFGGPVGMEQCFMLIRSAVPPEESLHVFRDIYVSTSMSLLKRVAQGGKGGEKFRLYAGYAGWAAGQLERELSAGDWHILQADPETVFGKDPEKIWQDLNRLSSGIRVKRESQPAGLLTAKAL